MARKIHSLHSTIFNAYIYRHAMLHIVMKKFPFPIDFPRDSCVI